MGECFVSHRYITFSYFLLFYIYTHMCIFIFFTHIHHIYKCISGVFVYLLLSLFFFLFFFINIIIYICIHTYIMYRHLCLFIYWIVTVLLSRSITQIVCLLIF